MRGPLAHNWKANIEVPIFKDGKPFRELTVIMRQEGLLRLLSAHDADELARRHHRWEGGPPEIMELQDTPYRATVERANSHLALVTALSRLEHEMGLREQAQAALAQSQRMEAIGQLSVRGMPCRSAACLHLRLAT